MNDIKAFRFRESFRGYNKDDVNAYIQQMSMIFSRKEAELRAYIAELEAAQIPPAPIVTISPEELEALKKHLADLEAENARLNEELAAKVEPAVAPSEEEKSKCYDAMSAQVGNILIVANSNAEKILADAKEEAARIRREAELLRDKKIAEFEAQLRMASEECVASYTALVNEAQSRFSELSDTVKARSVELLIRSEERCSEVEKKITGQYGNSSNP